MADTPDWLWQFCKIDPVPESSKAVVGRQNFRMRDGILRSLELASEAQNQTSDAFGFKWNKRDTFEKEHALSRVREWLLERYGPARQWFQGLAPQPLVLDAGCGAGMSALEYFEEVRPDIRYLGVDVSGAVDVARDRFASRGWRAGFMQADISRLPFGDRSVDLIFSEGVLHHTDSTRNALLALSRLLKPGGRFLFYVYRRKGPVREFTDDYIRGKLQGLDGESAWRALEPLTRLGIALGDLNAEVEIPEPIELLGIPAGRISVQRLFYWHVAKVFHHPEYSLDEMNHINFDWYMPKNAFRQSVEEVRSWCVEADLRIERERVEEAGITMVAVRQF